MTKVQKEQRRLLKKYWGVFPDGLVQVLGHVEQLEKRVVLLEVRAANWRAKAKKRMRTKRRRCQ